MTTKKKTVPKTKKQTHVVLVVDRSGSMSTIRVETFNSINKRLKAIKKNGGKGGKTFVTYIQFDDVIETVFANVPHTKLTEITTEQYVPRGYTAIYDALGKAVKHLQDTVVETDDTAYLIILVSDGIENASKEFNGASWSAKRTELEATGKWTFTYLFANVSEDYAKTHFGAHAGNAMMYMADSAGVNKATAVSEQSLGNYFSSRDIGLRSVSNFYSGDVINNPTPNHITTDVVDLTNRKKLTTDSNGGL